jgi:uncharacterized membrane protein
MARTRRIPDDGRAASIPTDGDRPPACEGAVMRALTLGLMGATAWGFWALLTKLATRSLAPEVVLVVSYVTGAVVGLVYLLATDVPLRVGGPGLGFALAAGVATGLGSVFYYAGLKLGRVSVVSTVTALYFVVAVLLGVLVLRESLDPGDVVGIVLAVAAVALLAR